LTLVEEYGGVRAYRARQRTSAGLADRQLARQLEVEVGAPLLLLTRSYTTRDGEKIMHIILWCRPDRYEHTIDFINESKEPSAAAEKATTGTVRKGMLASA
jgi:GntR family transcriptional regulator